MELEEQVMGIIINAGQSRSLCYEALSVLKRVISPPPTKK